jgi:hypothetical protein
MTITVAVDVTVAVDITVTVHVGIGIGIDIGSNSDFEANVFNGINFGRGGRTIGALDNGFDLAAKESEGIFVS